MYPYRRHKFRRGIRITMAAAAGLLALTAVGLVIEVAIGPHPAPDYNPPPVDMPGFSSPASPSATATGPALTGPLQVIQGRELVGGVYVGYPHTTQGAVSAAVEYMRDIGSTLDPDRAAAILRLTADPSYSQGPQQYAQGVVTTRNILGLPASGPVPEGASVVLQPVDYQVRNVSANQVMVLLLADYDVTLPGQGTEAKAGLYPLGMHWDGDWKILAPETSVDYSSLLAQPGTAQATADGWQELSP